VVTILTAMLNVNNNSPQNLCAFSIRIIEYNADSLTHYLIFFFFFRHWTSLMIENYGLLNIFPFPSILDAGYTIFNPHLANVLFDAILPSVRGSTLWFLVRGFHLNILLSFLASGILCTWPNQLSLWALIWLTIFLCFISLSNSSLIHITS